MLHPKGAVEYHRGAPMDETVGKLTSGEPLSVDQLIEFLAGVEGSTASIGLTCDGAARSIAIGRAKTAALMRGLVRPLIISSRVPSTFPSTIRWRICGPGQPVGFFGRSMARMKSFLTTMATKRAEAHERKLSGLTLNIDLPMTKPIANWARASFAMTCRTFQPRLGHGHHARTVRNGGNAYA